MTFNNLTQVDAIRIRDVLKQLADTVDAQRQADRLAKRQVALDWWDTIKPAVPTTRDEAFTTYTFIESTIVTETALRDAETDQVQKEIHHYRILILNEKLKQANEKFKEIKANG